MHRLVLLRHGESVWNQENRFTGWTDVGLTDKGLEEARQAGRLMLQEGSRFDIAFTSVLKRAIKTLWVALGEMEMDVRASVQEQPDLLDITAACG